MKWFNEHLNWTFGIIVVISFAILIPLAVTGATGPAIIGGIIFAAINIAGGLWVLRKKGQSPWYVVLAIVFYVGFLVLMPLLKNNKSNQDENKKISDADYYKDRETR